MAYNKVVLGDETVLDLTGDTVAADKLAEGYTAHDASGNQITGTMASGGDDPFTPIQDGKTRIYVNLREGRTSPMLGVCPNGTVIVDWGDGTATDTLTGTSTSTTKWTPKHNYAAPGNYVITLTVSGTMGLNGGSSSGTGSSILRNSSSTDLANRVYTGAIYAVEIGENVPSIGAAAFCDCILMKSIFIPDSVTSIGTYAFQNCTNLSSISIPNDVTEIENYAFRYCYGLSNIFIPNGVTAIGSNSFYNCYSLSSISIPDGITKIETNTFQSCYSLSIVSVPSSVTTINGNAFASCSGVAYFDFTKHTSVPTLSNTTVFSNIAADAQILVPIALADEWKAKTNWANQASRIVGV